MILFSESAVPEDGALSRTDRALLQARSPLWMVTREPHLTRLVEFLDDSRERIQADPGSRHTLVFHRSQIEGVREAFARTIRRGEEKLHRLASLLCTTFYASTYEMQSVVVGEVESTRERFMLMQPLSERDVYQHTDLDLGSRLVRRLQFLDGDAWSRATLVANFVEYQPHEVNPHALHKIISRIKAEEELWNKVVDEIFHLDELVARDKKLRHLSRFIKDVFGIKAVVAEEEDVRRLHDSLLGAEWTHSVLDRHGIPADAETERLDFVEVKDYLGDGEGKRSGWQAMKSVVRWWGETFEIQIQPMRNYHRERERLTQESHAGFKRSRESVRDQVAAEVPLFGFYQRLLRWLFLSPAEPAPTFGAVTAHLED